MPLARSPIFSRRFPGGAFVFADVREMPGAAIFVDSVNGSSSNDGSSPDAALATLAQGVSAATAAKCDTIFLMPGHAESKTATGNIVDVNKSGIRIIGLGSGSLQPTFTLGHAGATFTVSAAGVLIRNVKIVADTADVAVGLTASAAADGLCLERCLFTSGALTKELQIGVSLAAACDDVVIDGCRFETIITAETGSETNAILLAGAADRLTVKDCVMIGNFGTAAIDGATAASVRIALMRNLIYNIDSTNGLAISLHASTNGIVADNRCVGLKTNTKPVVAAGCAVFENYTAAAVGESGIVWPAVETYA